jgi:hypothetical protein
MDEILGFRYIDNSIYIPEESKDLIIEKIQSKLEEIQNDLKLTTKEKIKNIRDLIYGDVFESFIKTEQNNMTIDFHSAFKENPMFESGRIKNVYFDKLMELRRLGLSYIGDNNKVIITDFLNV